MKTTAEAVRETSRNSPLLNIISHPVDHAIGRISAPWLLLLLSRSRILLSIVPALTGFALVSTSLLAAEGPAYVSTFAGSSLGYKDGYRTDALFFSLGSLQKDPLGRVWVSEAYMADWLDAGYGAHRIRIIDTNGLVTTFAGSEEPGLVDGPAAQARFRAPYGLVFDHAGNAFVADRLNHRIRKLNTEGIVSTFAGSSQGFKDGPGTEAMFYMPIGLAIDSNDNIYVADFGNTRIRKITPEGVVSTIAGSSPGNTDGAIDVATFNGPNDVAVDTFGNLFVSDWVNGRVRKISGDTVTTIADNLPYTHTVDVAPDGDLLVVCGGCASIIKMSTEGAVRWSYQPARGFLDGPAEIAQFSEFIYDTLVLPNGDILTIDGSNYRIRRLEMTQPPTTIENLVGQVKALLPANKQRPLLATLAIASKQLAADRKQLTISQLQIFQDKVRAQVAASYPDAAQELIRLAQRIIDSLP